MFGSYRAQHWPFQWVSKLRVLLKEFMKKPLFPFWPTLQFPQSIMTRTYWTCHPHCFFSSHLLFFAFSVFPTVFWELILRWGRGYCLNLDLGILVSTPVYFSYTVHNTVWPKVLDSPDDAVQSKHNHQFVLYKYTFYCGVKPGPRHYIYSTTAC